MKQQVNPVVAVIVVVIVVVIVAVVWVRATKPKGAGPEMGSEQMKQMYQQKMKGGGTGPQGEGTSQPGTPPAGTSPPAGTTTP